MSTHLLIQQRLPGNVLGAAVGHALVGQGPYSQVSPWETWRQAVTVISTR